MYDDIANNDLNPRKGVIINHPNGSDVYAGVPKVKKHHNLLLFAYVKLDVLSGICLVFIGDDKTC